MVRGKAAKGRIYRTKNRISSPGGTAPPLCATPSEPLSGGVLRPRTSPDFQTGNFTRFSCWR